MALLTHRSDEDKRARTPILSLIPIAWKSPNTFSKHACHKLALLIADPSWSEFASQATRSTIIFTWPDSVVQSRTPEQTATLV